MKVIEKYNDSMHNPFWKFQLGPETYQVKDTPLRVEAIKKQLHNNSQYKFIRAKKFSEQLISRLHPYHDYIKKTSARMRKNDEEFYPDLFPGDGAGLRRRVDEPLWGGQWCTDAVTPIMKKTYAVARASAETALTGAELILSGSEQVVYALCRPSGHHAGPRVFGGYCYFNNAATAAEFLAPHGKVAILDIDYHHGNGTQEFFEERKYVFTCSIHGDPDFEYPYFWGYSNEKGRGQGSGTNLNIPLPKKTNGASYLKAIDKFRRAVRKFAPDYLIIAAGFDTHQTDPIGGFSLKTKDYTEIGARLASLGIPTLICQEGGYNTEVLGYCVDHLLTGFERGR